MRVIAPQQSDGRAAKSAPSRSAVSDASRADGGRSRTSQVRAVRGRRRPFSELGLAAFFSNSATLLRSGVPLIKALEALAEDDTIGRAGPTLDSLIQDIRAGSSFSAALAKHPRCFSALIVSLVRAGEAGGKLVGALERISEGIDKRRETKHQIKSALTYPAIVTVLGSGAVGFLMVFVVPVFEETYQKAHMPLPTITLALIGMSGLLARTWWMGLGLLITAGLLYRKYRHLAGVQMLRDRWLIRIPAVGPVIRTAIVGRFVNSFGNLLAAGVSIKESLALTEQVVGHAEYAAMTRELQNAVARGEGIGRKLGEYRSLFSPLLIRMMSLGEQSGELGPMVMEVGRYTEKDLRRRIQQMSSLVEPLVTVLMALAIGSVALAIYLPIFDMFKQVG